MANQIRVRECDGAVSFRIVWKSRCFNYNSPSHKIGEDQVRLEVKLTGRRIRANLQRVVCAPPLG